MHESGASEVRLSRKSGSGILRLRSITRDSGVGCCRARRTGSLEEMYSRALVSRFLVVLPVVRLSLAMEVLFMLQYQWHAQRW